MAIWTSRLRLHAFATPGYVSTKPPAVAPAARAASSRAHAQQQQPNRTAAGCPYHASMQPPASQQQPACPSSRPSRRHDKHASSRSGSLAGPPPAHSRRHRHSIAAQHQQLATRDCVSSRLAGPAAGHWAGQAMHACRAVRQQRTVAHAQHRPVAACKTHRKQMQAAQPCTQWQSPSRRRLHSRRQVNWQQPHSTSSRGVPLREKG